MGVLYITAGSRNLDLEGNKGTKSTHLHKFSLAHISAKGSPSYQRPSK